MGRHLLVQRDGRRIPVDAIAVLSYPRAPLVGLAEFTARATARSSSRSTTCGSASTICSSREEGVGQVTGTLALRRQRAERRNRRGLAAARGDRHRPHRAHAQSDAEITFRFHDSSLDPYVRLFVPSLSRVHHRDRRRIDPRRRRARRSRSPAVDGTVDSLELRLLDYAVHNATPIRSRSRRQIRVDELRLVGDRHPAARWRNDRPQRRAHRAPGRGDANLGILQGSSRRSAGRAAPSSRRRSTARFAAAVLRHATLTDGRIRHLSCRTRSTPSTARSVSTPAASARRRDRDDGRRAVRFGGRIGFDGYVPADLDVTARGEDMHLRYPEGIRSVVDADLAVRGNVRSPTLGGSVTVKNASGTAASTRRAASSTWSAPLDGRRRGASTRPSGRSVSVEVRRADSGAVDAASREQPRARWSRTRDLTLRGTYDRR
jgi:hypothetical protein